MMKYLALGDSYTIGESVNESQCFPVQLTQLLRNRGYEIAEPVIIAKTGWTTDELATAIEERNVTDTFDIVTLLIGVNNQYRGRDIENYRQEFISLLNTAIRFTGENHERVIVISIPDWGLTPFAENDKRGRDVISREIDTYNEVNRMESKDKGIKYIDITPISRLALDDETLTAEDKLHPSGKMYSMWAEEILPAADSVLRL